MSTVIFYAQFLAGVSGKDGLTVTWDVDQITRADGTRSALVTGGANSVTIGRRGLYGYVLTNADLNTYDYIATAVTTDATVNAKEVSALWIDTIYSAETSIAAINAKTTNLPSSPAAAGDVATVGSSVTSVIAALAILQGNVTTILADYARRTGDYAGVTALATLQGNVTTILADYARRTGDYATAAAVAAIPTTPLLAANYTAPDNADIASIRAKTDNLPASPAASGDIAAGLTSQGYTSTRSGYLDVLNGLVAAIWAATTRTLTVSPESSSVWDELLSGLSTSGSVGKALADLLGVFNTTTRTLTEPVSADLVVITPVLTSGDIKIIRGDDYYAVDGRSLSWVSTAWPDLSGAELTFVCGDISITAEASGSGEQTIMVELSDEDTASVNVTEPSLPFSISAVLGNGHKAKLIQGMAIFDE